MSNQVQLRRGTATQHSTFTGAEGEVTYDTTNKKLKVHDGSTAGGNLVGGISHVLEDTTPQLGGELDQNAHTIGCTEYNNGDSGTSKTIDWKLGNHQKVTMTGNCTFTFTAPTKACMLSLRFINDGAAGRTRTLPTIKWPGGTAPTWTTTANAIDVLSLFYDGSAYYGQAGLAFA